MFRRSRLVGVPLLLLICVSVPALSQKGASVEWPYYGGDAGSTKYSSLDEIDRTNFDRLEIAWRFKSPDGPIQEGSTDRWIRRAGLKVTPLFIDGVLYATTGLGQVMALDAASGEALWVYNSRSYEAGAPASFVGFSSRGLAYWRDRETESSRGVLFHGTSDGYLLALYADTGELVPFFGRRGRVDAVAAIPRADREQGPDLPGGESQWLSIDSPPVVCRDVVVIGSSMSDRPPSPIWPPGDVQAFDVRSGQPRWVFHTIPRQGEPGVETWENDSWKTMGNANVWSMMSADQELGIVYLPTTTPTSDYYGADRLGDNLYAESLVAVDCATGKRVWHFQMVHHGLWDYDLPAAPNLVDITVDGREIAAVAQVSKQGFTYVFDRRTGEPVWPIEERPVASSDVPGERTSPTQPFPTKPPPFERQGVAIDDLIDWTPKLRAEAIEIVKDYRIGPIFTPPSLVTETGTRGTIALPGGGGGANWSGAAVDPESGWLYVPSRTRFSLVMFAEPDDPTVAELRYIRNGTLGPKSFNPLRPTRPTGPRGLPLLKPPYSRMTAIDLNTGEIAWMVPTGRGERAVRDHPDLQGIELGDLGGQGRCGPLLTKTLLIHGLEEEGESTLVAYDKRTGALLGKVPVPGMVTGTPMTYQLGDKQYIVVAVAGSPSEIVALRLP